MNRELENTDPNQSYDSYFVATLRMGKTNHFVGLEPYSPHGGQSPSGNVIRRGEVAVPRIHLKRLRTIDT
jgi:hypothetical protein